MADDLLVRAAIRDELSAPLENIREHLERAGDEAVRSGTKANLGARGFDKLVSSGAGVVKFLGRSLVSAARLGAVALAGLVVGAAALSIKLIGLSSDAAETASAFSTVFGKSTKEVDKWVANMGRKYGLATADLQAAATKFGVFGKAAGIARKELPKFSTSLGQAGLDLASFYNTTTDEALLALQSGLTGEAEPLRRFGIFLSDAAMQAQALKMGIGGANGEMTEGEKVQVRQALILKGLGDAQGDMARTADGFANSQRFAAGRIKELGTRIGDLLKLGVTPLLAGFNDRLGPAVQRVTKFADAYTKAVEDAGIGSAEAAETLDILDGNTGKLRRGYTMLTDAVNAYKDHGLDGLIVKMDEQHGANGKLIKVYQRTRGVLDDIGRVIKKVIIPAFEDAGDTIPIFLSPLAILRKVLKWAANNTDDAKLALEAFIVYLVAAKAATKGAAAYTAIAGGAQAVYAAGLVTTTAATGAATTSTWSLNAAMRANPIGLIVTALTLLAVGLFVAYKKSETFRTIVDKLGDALKWVWDKVLKPFGKWLGGLFIGYIKLVGKIWLTVLTGIVKGLGWFAEQAMAAFGMILDGAESAFGWMGFGIGDKIRAANDAFDTFADGVNSSFDKVAAKLQDAKDGIDRLGQDPVELPVVITVDAAQLTSVEDRLARSGGVAAAAGGDTALARADHYGRTSDHLARTMAAHNRYAGTGIRVTNALMGGGGRGHGSGDHQAGRALDLQGPNLGRYAARLRAEGGYAAMHGSGAGRHLHAVPAGDTATSHAGPARGATVVNVPVGAVQIDARGLDATSVGTAVERGLAAAIRHSAEASYT